MDKRKSVSRLWIFTLCTYSLLVLGKACQVDEGQFITTITVLEEAEIGSVVGGLKFDNPDQIEKVEVVDSNPYFDYLPTNNSFVVTSRIDVDRGLNTVQLMILECMPKNGPKLEIEVEFELRDINDFSPVFQPTNKYTFQITEAAVQGAQIGTVEAKDNDIKNFYIDYELEPSLYSDYFYLKPNAGGKAVISLSQSLDYETRKTYNLTIIAKDCQRRQDCTAGQRNATAEVTIEVTDADDLSPEFESSTYTASIFEDSVRGTVVVQLVALDQDALNDPVMYAIDGEGSQYFSVNAYTGMVAVTDTAGMIRGTQYLLQAKAWQVNDPTKRTATSLVIKVVATNGNAPQFTEHLYDVTLSEGSPINTTAISFTVSDRDTASQLDFKIVEGPSILPFTLYITGWNSADLKVATPLDYEVTQAYTLKIQVSDGEFMSKADVHIRVLNDNDHNPEFVNTEPYEFEVNWEAGALVGVVKATDRDAVEDNSHSVTYKILPPHDSLFEVDNEGRITLSSNREDYTTTEYHINVQAMDKGKSPRSTTTVVKIILNLPALQSTSDAVGSKDEKGVDRVIIYVVAAVAGFLLILVALLIMCFLKRKAKKTARQLRKDTEHASYDKPYALKPTDTLNSSTDSQLTYQTQMTVVVSDERSSQTHLESTLLGDSSTAQHLGPELDVDSDSMTRCQNLSMPNNLSVISDSDTECKETGFEIDNSNKNILPVLTVIPVTTKCSSDSGRSSMREDRSYMKQMPFQSFQHSKSASIDDNGNTSQDEEISMATFQRKYKGLHTQNGALTTSRPDICNVRATEGPPVRTSTALSQNSINNSGFIAEVPEGFRSADFCRRTPSSHSTTSDYESNTPTPEITSKSMLDYCVDLPTHVRISKSNNYNSESETYGSKNISGSLYSDKPMGMGMESTGTHRSDTPCSYVSTESDGTTSEERNTRPQMTIYF